MDFLGSPLWSGIGVLVAIVLGVIAIALAFIQIKVAQSRKIIAYDVVSDAPIVTVNDEVKSRVKILLDNTSIENARLVVIDVLNGGGVPIQTIDYENNSPIRFDFGAGVEILNVDVLETSPKSLKPSLNFKSEQVLLEPLLLNSQDSFKFKILLTGFKGNIKVEGRISGVKEIITFNNLPSKIRKRKVENLVTIGAAIGMAGAVLSVFIGLIMLKDGPFSASYSPTLLSYTIISLLIFAFMTMISPSLFMWLTSTRDKQRPNQ